MSDETSTPDDGQTHVVEATDTSAATSTTGAAPAGAGPAGAGDPDAATDAQPEQDTPAVSHEGAQSPAVGGGDPDADPDAEPGDQLGQGWKDQPIPGVGGGDPDAVPNADPNELRNDDASARAADTYGGGAAAIQ